MGGDVGGGCTVGGGGGTVGGGDGIPGKDFIELLLLRSHPLGLNQNILSAEVLITEPFCSTDTVQCQAPNCSAGSSLLQ